MASAPQRPRSPIRITDFVDRLAESGRYHFSTEEAVEALGVSEVAARAAIRRLKKRGAIAAPQRGFHVLVSPEHRAAGCPPAEQFIPQLMEYLEAPYYAGLMTAAQFYGEALEPPEAFQVVTRKNRPSIHCGRVQVQFVARQYVDIVPVRMFDTPRGSIRVSSPEATAIDLVAYPQIAGDLDTVALVLEGLAAHIDGERLLEVATETAEMPWVQRLGYLLDRAGVSHVTEGLARYVADEMPPATPLDPRLAWRGVPRDARWRLALNAG